MHFGTRHNLSRRQPQLPAGGEKQRQQASTLDGLERFESITYLFDDRIDTLDWSIFNSDQPVAMLLRPARSGLRLVCAIGDGMAYHLETADGEGDANYISVELTTKHTPSGREREAVIMFDSTQENEPRLGYVKAEELIAFLQRHADPSTWLRLMDVDRTFDAYGVDDRGSIYNGPLGKYPDVQ